jgi:hypothetical protein
MLLSDDQRHCVVIGLLLLLFGWGWRLFGAAKEGGDGLFYFSLSLRLYICTAATAGPVTLPTA